MGVTTEPAEERSPPRVGPGLQPRNVQDGRNGRERSFQSLPARERCHQPTGGRSLRPKEHGGQNGGRHKRRGSFATHLSSFSSSSSFVFSSTPNLHAVSRAPAITPSLACAGNRHNHVRSRKRIRSKAPYPKTGSGRACKAQFLRGIRALA
jgi:hypothetical protein